MPISFSKELLFIIIIGDFLQRQDFCDADILCYLFFVLLRERPRPLVFEVTSQNLLRRITMSHKNINKLEVKP